ncbi:MAG: GNAT family protein [Pseudomonadota bacterium]
MYLTSGPTALRRLSPDDLRAFQAYRNDPAVALYQSWDEMDDDRALGFLEHMAGMTPLFQPDQWAQIGVADAANRRLIGDMGIHLSADATEVELGITLAAHAQGRGHGLRATQLACAYVFAQTTAAQIKVWADIRNAASRALAERAGFTFTGIEVNDGVTEAAFAKQRPNP